MKKLSPKIIIILILAVILIASIVSLLTFSRSRQKQPLTPSSLPSPSPSPFKPYSPNKYQKIIFEDEKRLYQISYFPLSNNYLISVTGSPFEQYRKEAEKAFINQLNLSTIELCKLDVTIATSYITNPKESEKSYRLSFCRQFLTLFFFCRASLRVNFRKLHKNLGCLYNWPWASRAIKVENY